MDQQQSRGRDVFRSGLGAFAATVGSAVGLGNIWRFPYDTGRGGGAAFVLTYVLCVALVGLPVMVAEHAIGRRMRRNAVHVYESLLPSKGTGTAIGYVGLVAAVLIMAFYTDVAGWVFAYVFKSLGALAHGVALGPADFESLSSGTWEPLLWQAGVLSLASVIIALGVSNGIERVTKMLMPVLFLLLVVCDVRALTLPGSGSGVSYLFKPDLSKLSGPVLLSALGLAFFKLSLGIGAMTTYGSYLPENTRIVPNAARVVLADTAVSLLAGLAIFPALFALGGQPSGGPGLLFITIPLVFSKMPMGGLFTTLFFVLAATATIGAMVSIMEVPVAWFTERTHVSRLRASVVTAAVMFGVGVLATLSRGPVLSGVKIFGKSFFDLFIYLSNLLLPLGGLAITVAAGWLLPQGEFSAEIAKGHVMPGAIHALMGVLVRFLAPVLIVIVLLMSLWGR